MKDREGYIERLQTQNAALQRDNAKLKDALAKAAVILKTQEKNLGTVGLSVLALADSLSKE